MIHVSLIALVILAFTIEQVQRWLSVGGPMLMFSLLFACGLGLPLPEDIPLILGGFFAANQGWNLVLVCVLAWCGIIGGDCVLYNLGRRFGLNITRVPFVGKHVTRDRIEKAERLFERYGIWVVAVGRLFAGIRGAMVIAAGTIRYSFVKFVIADGLAALVSGGLFIALGYFLGKKLSDPRKIMETIEPYKHWVIMGIIVMVLLVVAYIWFRAKRHKTLTDAALEKVDEAAG